MICYKDKTFCPFNDCTQFYKCPDALTKKVKEDAERWMKNAPIAHYTNKPDCYLEAK